MWAAADRRRPSTGPARLANETEIELKFAERVAEKIHLAHNLAAGLILALIFTTHAPAQVDYVDPTIGNVGILLEPTRPTVFLPNSMVRVYPVRADALDDQIKSFPLTISSHRMHELFSIMPGDGAPQPTIRKKPRPITTPRASTIPSFRRSSRQPNVAATFVSPFPMAKPRSSWPTASPAICTCKTARSHRRRTLQRHEGLCLRRIQRARHRQDRRPQDGKQLTISAPDTRSLDFRYGISFISVEQAKQNLQHEIPAWGLAKVKEAARRHAGTKALGQIAVEGGTEAQRRVFYTALYRCFERMVNITEDGRYYSGFDHQVHEDARPFYVDNWLWDTYRALEPLQTLLNPEMEADKIQSYVRMYQQSGIMPTFAIAVRPLRLHERQPLRALVCRRVVQRRAQLRSAHRV